MPVKQVRFVPTMLLVTTPGRTRSTLVRVLMGLVALSGAVCAAMAVALGRRGDGVVALVAAIATTASSAAVAADDYALGPFLEVPVLLGSVVVLAAGAWGVWVIGVERAAALGS